MSAEKNETIIVNALLAAAGVYDNDAKHVETMAEAMGHCPEGMAHLKQAFERQAEEARELADKIEQSGLDQAAFL